MAEARAGRPGTIRDGAAGRAGVDAVVGDASAAAAPTRPVGCGICRWSTAVSDVPRAIEPRVMLRRPPAALGWTERYVASDAERTSTGEPPIEVRSLPDTARPAAPARPVRPARMPDGDEEVLSASGARPASEVSAGPAGDIVPDPAPASDPRWLRRNGRSSSPPPSDSARGSARGAVEGVSATDERDPWTGSIERAGIVMPGAGCTDRTPGTDRAPCTGTLDRVVRAGCSGRVDGRADRALSSDLAATIRAASARRRIQRRTPAGCPDAGTGRECARESAAAPVPAEVGVVLTLGEFPGAVDPAGDVVTDAVRRRRSCGVSMDPAARTSGGRRMGIALGVADWEKDPGVQVFSSGTRLTTRSSPRAGDGPVRSVRLGREGRPARCRIAASRAPTAVLPAALAPVDAAINDGAVDSAGDDAAGDDAAAVAEAPAAAPAGVMPDATLGEPLAGTG